VPGLSRKTFNPFVILLLLFLVGVPLYFFRTGENRVKKTAQTIRKILDTKAEIAITNFHYTEREQEMRKWEIRADRAERFLTGSRIHMDRVRMEYILKEGGVVRLSGRSGDYYEKERRVVLSGDVRVVTETGYTLFTERLTWNVAKNLIFSDQPVRLIASQYEVRGGRMSFRTNGEELLVEKGVRAVLFPVSRTGGAARE